MAAGVQPGDVVVTVPNTFIATTEAITQAGATPDFVDVNERTYNLDAEQLPSTFRSAAASTGPRGGLYNKKLGRPVTAVVPVHLYGLTGGYGFHFGLGGALRPARYRRRLPSPRRGILLA